MYIDCHTHCRDEKWENKETISRALRVAEDSGLSGIFDMPNVPDPVISRKRVVDRLELAAYVRSRVFYGVYVGLTADKDQIRGAVGAYKEFFPRSSESTGGVIGLKMFAGKSVGDLTISNPEEQQEVYYELTKLGYRGVLAVHCEKETEMMNGLYDPRNPISHCSARPPRSEVESVKDQIRFAREARYNGGLHILHVSVPESVDLILDAKKDLRISCGVTPHHLLLDERIMLGSNGVFFKVNPPLRDSGKKNKLLSYFKKGYLDVLESDHAPHTLKDKLEKQMSGICNLASWPDFVEILKIRGVSQELLDRVAYENINSIFGTQIPKLNMLVQRGKDLGNYVFDPYKSLKA